MAVYAILSEAKSYLAIPDAMTQFDGKIQVVLDGINETITEDTGEVAPNNKLKLGALCWLEKLYNKTAGSKSERDNDYSLTWDSEVVPAEAAHFIRPYVQDEYKSKYDTKNNKIANVIAG